MEDLKPEEIWESSEVNEVRLAITLKLVDLPIEARNLPLD
jgi:hypothetical protein